MRKMNKNINIVAIFVLIEMFSCRGIAYALRAPLRYSATMEEFQKKTQPGFTLIKETGRWEAGPGKEKWHEIHYEEQLRGWVFFEIKDGILTVSAISIPTNTQNWETVYKETLSRLRDIALKENAEKICFEKVSNDIFLKYIIEYFSIERIKTKDTDWFMPAKEGSGIKPWQFLLGSKATVRGFTITVYEGAGIKELSPVYPFGTGPNFTIKEEDGNLVIIPSRLSKIDVPGMSINYSISYDETEKRFKLTREGSENMESGIDFQLNEGYLRSDLEINCKVKPLPLTSTVRQKLPTGDFLTDL